jgi:hypothetical protein
MYSRILPKTKKKIKPASGNAGDSNLPAALVTLREKLKTRQIEELKTSKSQLRD